MKKLYLALCLVTLGLCGCGPMYNTQYSYTPPKSSAGLMCVTNCESSRNSCMQMETIKKENCEERTERDYRWCLHSHEHDGHKDHCYKESCWVDDAHCKAEYDTCYQGCGGVVTATQVCVAFCNNK
jgi:hypothetical protein